MYQWFDPVIRPLIDALGATTVVEVGADQGHLTRELLAWAGAGGDDRRVHIIDPRPRFDIDATKAEHGDRFVAHIGLSLSVIPTLPPMDAVLIDGDHNWFTVVNELRQLEQHVPTADGDWPVVLLHDVGWPYGRRDLYYDPTTIPDKERQPYRRAGIHPDHHEPSDDIAFNAHLDNALYENTAANGVLTAVEDFVAESGRDLEVLVVPGVHGLGVVWEPSSTTPDAAALLRSLQYDGLTRDVLEMIERDRITKLTELAEFAARLAAARTARDQDRTVWEQRRERWERETREQSAALRNAEEALAVASSQLDAATTRADMAGRRVADLEAQAAQHRAAREQAQDRADAMESKVASLTKRLERADTRYERLRGRRLVRLALWLASLAQPLFTVVRRVRRARSQPTPRPATQPAVADATRAAAPSAPRLSVPTDPRADIVVCVHNALDDVRRCLTSILEHTNLQRHRLVVVDDGSDEPTAAYLREFVEDNPDTVLLRNASARGYTCAANQGAAAGVAPFFVLLNSDTVVTAGWLEAMLRCATVMPDAAIVGPLSNAASWQSVPETTDEDGAWVVNDLPAGATPDDVASILATRGTQLYPRLTLINGFCYLVRREAADALGGLDEEVFPTGYGEEDDFSLRAQDAGFNAYLADDAYVFHAKSKSFTPEGRKKHVAANSQKLFQKHSEEKVRAAVAEVRFSDDLVRARTVASLALDDMQRTPDSPPDLDGLRVGWCQPHLRMVGGIRRAIEMSNRLTTWGAEVTLITPDGETADWLPMRTPVRTHQDAASEVYDVLIVSDPDVLDWSEDLSWKKRLVFHLGGYRIYRPKTAALEAFYRLDGTHIANSNWTAEVIAGHIPGSVEAIVPGAIDRRLFHPVRAEPTHDVVCYGSTRRHKGTPTIERAASGLRLLKMADHDLPQGQLAAAICSGRVFASGAWHEGFNLPPLEAMACGVPVAITDDGGSRDYAEDGRNALVVPVRDSDGLRAAIDRLLEDQALRASFIEEGLRTAWGFTWDRCTRALAEVLDDL